MQIEQHWVIAQTVLYSEQQVVQRNNRTWKLAKWDFAWIIHVRKEMEDSRLNAIRQLITFTNFSFQNLFLNCKKTEKNIMWQRAKTRPEWISQSNGSIGRPLGFVIDRLNTSASLYRIAPCLSTYSILFASIANLPDTPDTHPPGAVVSAVQEIEKSTLFEEKCAWGKVFPRSLKSNDYSVPI